MSCTGFIWDFKSYQILGYGKENSYQMGAKWSGMNPFIWSTNWCDFLTPLSGSSNIKFVLWIKKVKNIAELVGLQGLVLKEISWKFICYMLVSYYGTWCQQLRIKLIIVILVIILISFGHHEPMSLKLKPSYRSIYISLH